MKGTRHMYMCKTFCWRVGLVGIWLSVQLVGKIPSWIPVSACLAQMEKRLDGLHTKVSKQISHM